VKPASPHTGLRAFESALLLFSIVLSSPVQAQPGTSDILARTVAATSIDGEPGKTMTVGFVVSNQGTSERTVWVVLQTPKSWRVVLADPPFALAAGASDLRLVTLAIPATASEGVYDIRYVAAPADSPADSSVAIAKIRIPGVRKISLTLAESPKHVVSGSTYRATFVLTNHGNRPEIIRLSATGLQNRFVTRLEATSMQLAPQESRAIGVSVETQPNGGDAYYYRADLSAQLESDTTINASASSTVQILPGMQAVEKRYLDFPLQTTLRWGGEQGQSGPQFELFGSGPVNIQGTDRLDLLVRTPDLQQKSILGFRDEYRLGYSTQNMEAYLGDRNFVLSPLTEYGRYAFGGGVSYDDRTMTITALANRDRFLETHPQEAGGSVGVRITPDAEATANYLYRKDAEVAQIVTARALLTNLFSTQADIEIGRDFGEGKDNALSLSWYARRPWGSLAARYMHAGPGFHGYYNDMDFLSASATVYPFLAFRIDANYRDEERNINLDTSKYSAPRSQFYEIGLGYANFISVYYRSNGYSDRLPNPLYNRKDNSVLVQVGYAAARLGVLGQFESGNQQDEIQGYEYPFRRYALIASLSPSPLQSYGLNIEYEERRGILSQPASDRLSGSLRAGFSLPGGTRALINFFGSKTVSGIDQTYTYLDIALEHRLPMGHTIGVHVRQSTYTPAITPQDLAYIAEYSIPLAIPLKFSSTSGTIRGTFRNVETGMPVSGAILMLDGAAVLTDPSGHFLFPDVQPGPHSLQLDQSGIGLEYVTVPQLPLELNVTTDRIDLDISLIRGATVEGTVTLPAPVDTTLTDSMQQQMEPPRGVPDLLVELSGGSRLFRRRTDIAGRFDFKGLPPGQWRLHILGDESGRGHRIDPDTATFMLKPGDRIEIKAKAEPVQRQIRILEEGKVLKDSAASAAPVAPPPGTAPPEIPRAASATVIRVGNSTDYTVLVSSWKSRKDAEQQATLFAEALGIRAQVRPVKEKGKKTSYQVCVGSFASAADAEALAAMLRSAKR
jgi:SPOR domain